MILTGASRGLGLAMAQQFLVRPDTLLIGLSRKPSDALDSSHRAAGSTLEQWPQDLADPRAATARVEAWLQARDAAAIETAT